jgi:PII-like signaling protein
MRIEGPALRLRIYVGESDHHDGRPLYQAIVEMLRERGVAGATVLRGIEGYGAHARLHTARILRLSEDLPVVIETVDAEARLRPVLADLDALVGDGLITVEPVEVLAYRRGTGGADRPGGSPRMGTEHPSDMPE